MQRQTSATVEPCSKRFSNSQRVTVGDATDSPGAQSEGLLKRARSVGTTLRVAKPRPHPPRGAGSASDRGGQQSGVAIISVLLTVTLVTIIVSGLFLREHITVRSVQNRISLTQTRWVERAAIDWSKVILGADMRRAGASDHLGEPWAVPVAETRLDETVTAGASIDDDSRAATLSGEMADAQGLLNLNSLVMTTAEGVVTVNPAMVETFGRLLDLLGLPASLADGLAARILASMPVPPQAGLANEEPLPTALPLIRVGDLSGVRGFDPGIIKALEPFVTFLPIVTKVNVNTAPPEVLAAVVPQLKGLAGARQLIAKRERERFFPSLDKFSQAVGPTDENLDLSMLDVKSNFFLIRGLIRFGRVQSFSETLLQREPQRRRVKVIWQRRL